MIDLIAIDIYYRQMVGDVLKREGYVQQFPNVDMEKIADSVLGVKKSADGITLIVESLRIQSGALVSGKYKLSERLGEGGMGQVCLAEQHVPVNRQVAIKLIRRGIDSEGVLNRFEAERQELALPVRASNLRPLVYNSPR